MHNYCTSIIKADNVDLRCLYIDGTKIEANANRYSWVCLSVKS